MKKETREKANADQVVYFLSKYYYKWRLAKIMAIRKILEDKYNIFSSDIEILKQPDDKTGTPTITQEISNGLICSAISECVQYIEDLFVLIKFSNEREWFIKNVITYQAGSISKFIRNFNPQLDKVCEYFHLPTHLDSLSSDKISIGIFQYGIDHLINNLNEIINFYKDNVFFYNQYKHGLAIALRPYALFNNKLVREHRKKPLSGYIIAMDNLSIEKVFGQSSRFRNCVSMPNLTNNIKPHISELQNEDNLLRYFDHPKGEIQIDYILEYAQLIEETIRYLIYNIYNYFTNSNKRYLPNKNPKKQTEIEIKKDENNMNK